MSTGDTTQGRRLAVGVWDDPEQPQLRGQAKLTQPREPGDYCGPIVGYTGERPAVFFMLPVPADHPDAGVRHVASPPHDPFVEEADGTLTISPSILAVRPEGNGWHGYLERGVWRQV
jgi:hypothetical protein